MKPFQIADNFQYIVIEFSDVVDQLATRWLYT